MNIFNWFSSLYHKLLWVINFIIVHLKPIYDQLVAIIKDVKATDLKDEAARKEVFNRITLFIQARGIKISDSILNVCIELVYQLVRANRA